MSDPHQARDPFYPTYAAVALTIACLVAFAPARDQRSVAQLPSAAASTASTVWNPSLPSPRTAEHADAELARASIAAADQAGAH